MLSEMFFKYLKGSVGVKVEGLLCEELLSECAVKAIAVRKIKYKKYGFDCAMDIDDYKKFSALAKKRGMRCKVINKKGIRFLIFSNRKRYGLLLGTLIFIYVFSSLSGRIWNIEIKGEEILTEQQILENLEDLDVYIGAKKNSKNAMNLERSMLLKMKDLSFIALNFKGSNLEVLVNEIKTRKYIIDDEKLIVNVIAKKTGQITEMEVYSGMPVVKIGDTIEEGNLIVSGVFEGPMNKIHLTNARAKVMANVSDKLNVKVNFNQIDYVPINFTERIPFLKIGKYKINLKIKSNTNFLYKIIEEEKNIKLFGADLPIKIGIDEYTYYEKKDVVLTKEEVKAICLKELEELEKDKFKNNEIISKNVCHNIKNDFYEVTANYIVEIDIAENVKIYTD